MHLKNHIKIYRNASSFYYKTQMYYKSKCNWIKKGIISSKTFYIWSCSDFRTTNTNHSHCKFCIYVTFLCNIQVCRTINSLMPCAQYRVKDAVCFDCPTQHWMKPNADALFRAVDISVGCPPWGRMSPTSPNKMRVPHLARWFNSLVPWL